MEWDARSLSLTLSLSVEVMPSHWIPRQMVWRAARGLQPIFASNVMSMYADLVQSPRDDFL